MPYSIKAADGIVRLRIWGTYDFNDTLRAFTALAATHIDGVPIVADLRRRLHAPSKQPIEAHAAATYIAVNFRRCRFAVVVKTPNAVQQYAETREGLTYSHVTFGVFTDLAAAMRWARQTN